jgi:ubiquinone/menaquinone biosynthesis C-methylase UbiE
MSDAARFYDSLSDFYDGMISFDTRLEKERATMQNLRERVRMERVLDMGCGTGVQSIALAQLGARVIGVDVSKGMLSKAHAHARSLGVDVEFVHGDFLQPLPPESVDALLCFGNSLPHIPSDEDLCGVFTHWRRLLAPDGVVLLQLLNYRRILAEQQRIVNIRRHGDATIVRFYDFLPAALRFNILTIYEGPGAVTHTLQSTELQPFTDERMRDAASRAGFSMLDVYGDVRFAPYSEASTDCVVVMKV